MKAVLGRKQSISNDDWIKVNDNIEEYVSKEEMDLLVKQTVDDIIKKTKGKKAAYSWSGGKDSIALSHVCEIAGIYDCLLVVCDLEFPAFDKWVEDNKPEKLQIINTGQDIDWLAKHPEMLFPQKSKEAARWFSIVQHTGQRMYFKEHDLDILILGRRRADGNYVGRGQGQNIYTDRNGVTRFSPLSEWKHEHILACCHYYDLPVPPIYDWKNGYKCGTHNWAERQWTGSIMNGWEEIYNIDSSIVLEAAEKIDSAAEYLRYIK